MNKTNTAIVIQGPSSYVEELKQAWTGFDLIWSTWCGSESKYSSEDIAIFNYQPEESGTGNIAWQRLSTMEGIKKAKELGYTHVLKWRSDMLPTDSKKLTNLFNTDTLNFLAWHSDGYFVDYLMYGPIEQMLVAWEFETNTGSFAEQILTDNIWKNQFTDFHFIVHKLAADNDILWMKYNVSLLTYQQQTCYKAVKLERTYEPG